MRERRMRGGDVSFGLEVAFRFSKIEIETERFSEIVGCPFRERMPAETVKRAVDESMCARARVIIDDGPSVGKWARRAIKGKEAILIRPRKGKEQPRIEEISPDMLRIGFHRGTDSAGPDTAGEKLGDREPTPVEIAKDDAQIRGERLTEFTLELGQLARSSRGMKPDGGVVAMRTRPSQ